MSLDQSIFGYDRRKPTHSDRRYRSAADQEAVEAFIETVGAEGHDLTQDGYGYTAEESGLFDNIDLLPSGREHFGFGTEELIDDGDDDGDEIADEVLDILDEVLYDRACRAAAREKSSPTMPTPAPTVEKPRLPFYEMRALLGFTGTVALPAKNESGNQIALPRRPAPKSVAAFAPAKAPRRRSAAQLQVVRHLGR